MLIGFSQGAFTVCRIAAFIHDVGLLARIGLKYLDSVYRHWQAKNSYRVVSVGFSVIQHERRGTDIGQL
jgi:uncharacterized protein (DUF2235 family)